MHLRIAILISGKHGRGSNMASIAAACQKGKINGTVVTVIGNFAESPALARAREMGVPTSVVSSKKRIENAPQNAYADELLALLNAAAPDLICLAGYTLQLPEAVVRAYSGRVMNIHNALLPSFGGKGMYGLNVHRAALDYGVKVSGCTVHFVDESYDTGPVILQKTVPVLDTDSPEDLAARVLEQEHVAYPEAVKLFAESRLTLHGRRVLISAS